jgi:hypothetical protein
MRISALKMFKLQEFNDIQSRKAKFDESEHKYWMDLNEAQNLVQTDAS